MINACWILIDTETTGFTTPIFTVEIAAQKMQGWSRVGPSFRRLLNQNADIPPESSRVHGYTREILERDGEPAHEVYRDFARYVDGLPIVAYNLSYDLDEVLLPEWARLGIKPIGSRGFCALKLSQRLLDPVPAGNCKLQTLRQYYRLPERGAHTALGDVDTVADLLGTVLHPIAAQRGLHSWTDVLAFTESEWFPSRIVFGKHKGRNFREARNDPELLGWLKWLAGSTNDRGNRMGRWYLQQLEAGDVLSGIDLSVASGMTDEVVPDVQGEMNGSKTDIAIYANPDVAQIQKMISMARTRLAELEAQYTQDRHAVDVVRATLFGLLRKHYQARDRVRLVIEYRRKYLATLLQSGEESIEQVTEEFEQAKAKSDTDYEQLGITTHKQKALKPEEALELRSLWKKLVRLYHPDRFTNEPDKLEAHHLLTSAINLARDNGDLHTLREIANDPHGFMLRKGWASLDFKDLDAVADLQHLWETLQLKVVTILELLNELHESQDYELQRLTQQQPELLNEVVSAQAAAIDAEVTRLESEAVDLGREIQELSGRAT